MATRSVVQNPIRKGYAVLTPQVFRAIDLRARKFANSVFEVSTHDDMRGYWGIAHLMSGDVFLDVRKLRHKNYDGAICGDACALSISNQVSVADFHDAQRPEIDLSAIPANRIYDYVSWHEVGHRADNFETLIFQRKELIGTIGDEKTVMAAWHKLNEVLADRFAWSKMFPDEPFPVRCGQEQISAWASEWTNRFAAAGLKRGMGKQYSLDTNPLTLVPTNHVRKGIPWSPLAKPELEGAVPLWLAGIKRAQIDVHDFDLCRFQKIAQRMAYRWARIAANPTTDVMETYNRTGNIYAYLFDDEKADLVRGSRNEVAILVSKEAA